MRYKIGKCEWFRGIQNTQYEPTKCCAEECLDYCGAENCGEKDANKCCPNQITSAVCGLTNAETGSRNLAPCTLGSKIKIYDSATYLHNFLF